MTSSFSIIITFVIAVVLVFLTGSSSASCTPCKWSDYNETLASQQLNTTMRHKTFKCIFKLMDKTPHDWRVHENEFDAFKEKTLTWKERIASRWTLLKWRCDCDCDDTSVTLEEALISYKTCLSSDFQVEQAWKRLCVGEDIENAMPGSEGADMEDHDNNA